MAREDHNPCEDCPAQNGQPFEVWPENTQAILLFVLVMTQFRRTDALVFGLDYVAVDHVARWNGIEIDAKLHESLRICELQYMSLVNKRDD